MPNRFFFFSLIYQFHYFTKRCDIDDEITTAHGQVGSVSKELRHFCVKANTCPRRRHRRFELTQNYYLFRSFMCALVREFVCSFRSRVVFFLIQ
jgi:hypothetical protein